MSHLCIVGEFQFLCRHLLLSVFFDIASLVGVKPYFILVSICISPCGSQCWGSFLRSLSICLSSLGKSSEYLCPSFNHALYLVLLMFKNSLSILDGSVKLHDCQIVPDPGVSFHFIDGVLWRKTACNCDEVHFFCCLCGFFFILCLEAIAKTSPANSQVTEVYSIVLKVLQPSLLICVSWFLIVVQDGDTGSLFSFCFIWLCGTICWKGHCFSHWAVSGTVKGWWPVRVWVHCSTLTLFLRYVLISALHCLEGLFRILKFWNHVFLFPVYGWKHAL